MREILFRGKPSNALSENKFIYGLLVKQFEVIGNIFDRDQEVEFYEKHKEPTEEKE